MRDTLSEPRDMGELTDRLQNAATNAGLVVGVLVLAALGYAFFVRWTTDDPSPISRARGDLGDIIQVDVRNGCGLPGLASQMTEYLRDYGFDVVEQGNVEGYGVENSQVLDRVGNPRAAEALARSVGLTVDRVTDDVQPTYFLDATIILGADYRSLHPFVDQATAVDLPACP